LRTLELYIKAYLSEPLSYPGTPMKIHCRIDEMNFLDNAIGHKILGPICAIGYYAQRDSIGAFQLWEPERYRGPIVPNAQFGVSRFYPHLERD
jgi:hypothetical protein